LEFLVLINFEISSVPVRTFVDVGDVLRCLRDFVRQNCTTANQRQFSLMKFALSCTTRQTARQLDKTARIIKGIAATSLSWLTSHLHTNILLGIRMTMTSDNEKDAASSSPEISKKEEIQGEKEPEENKATPGSSNMAEPAESIEDASGPEPQEEGTQGKVDHTGGENIQALAHASPAAASAPAAETPWPKKKKAAMHSEHSDDEDMEDDHDDDDGDKSSDNNGKSGKDDFRIPARYTKSGRRRATPFPLKVRTIADEAQ
jgi:hypothetical protein